MEEPTVRLRDSMERSTASVTSFSVAETATFLKLLRLTNFVSSLLVGGDHANGLSNVVELELEQHRRGHTREIPRGPLSENDIADIRALVQKLNPVLANLPPSTTVRFVTVPDGMDTASFVQNVLATGGADIEKAKNANRKPTINADSRYVDQILRGEKGWSIGQRFALLVYDREQLRQIRPDEINEYLSINHAYAPREDSTFPSALRAVLSFGA